MPQQVTTPAPGSPEAIAQGCTCPVLDNGHGRGYLGDGERFGWVMSLDCPLHGTEAADMGQGKCHLFLSGPFTLPLRHRRAGRPGKCAKLPGVLLRNRYGHAATGSRK